MHLGMMSMYMLGQMAQAHSPQKTQDAARDRADHELWHLLTAERADTRSCAVQEAPAERQLGSGNAAQR